MPSPRALPVHARRASLAAGALALALGAGPHAAAAPPSEAAAAPASEAADRVLTRLLVRAVAQDAKVIGSGVGGARITVRDAESGEVLARGVQEGSTGSTRAIMEEVRPRGLTAYGADPEAAGFVAELDLDRPTRVVVTAEGPLGTPHALQTASKSLTLIPGVDILGEGLILELNGFTVELLAAERLRDASSAAGAPSEPRLRVRARVTMLCGCPTEPGGMWDADDISVVGRLVRDGEVVSEEPLSFAGETSVYAGALPLPERAEGLELQVYAADPGKANVGIVRSDLAGALAGGAP